MELLTLSIGIGLAIGLLFAELFGVTAGGMVVPGYIALNLHDPVTVILTLIAGLATFFIVQGLSSVMLIYGRRRTVFMILIGYCLGMGLQMIATPPVGPFGKELDVVGFIIPGLIGMWLDRQGVVETISSLIIVSVMVRLILILTVGMDVQ